MVGILLAGVPRLGAASGRACLVGGLQPAARALAGRPRASWEPVWLPQRLPCRVSDSRLWD
jgi:hypothetical protein